MRFETVLGVRSRNEEVGFFEVIMSGREVDLDVLEHVFVDFVAELSWEAQER